MPAPSTESIAELPEWAQTHIADLRRESAEHRSNLRAAETRVTALESEVQTAADQAATLQTQLDEQAGIAGTRETELSAERFGRLRDRLATERGIPLDVAESLNAADEESLTPLLDSLAAFRSGAEQPAAPTPQPNPAQAAEPALDPDAQRTADAEAFFASAGL